MPLVPGLSANIREEAAPAAPLPEAADIEIIDADEGADVPEMDDKGNILRIDHPDGSITVSVNGNPVADADDENPPGWFDNLVDEIDDLELSRISDELMRGISDDQQSRQDWVEDRATGLRLLGLKIEIPGLQGAADGAHGAVL